MDRLAAVLAAAFRLLARLRRGRALHPLGVGYHARLEITPGAGRWAGARLLVPGARYDAVVRFSRGGGLPEPLPDALGVAVRLPDAYGPGLPGHQLGRPAAGPPPAVSGAQLPAPVVLQRPPLQGGRPGGGDVLRPQLARWPGPAGPWPSCRRPRRPASWSTSCGWPGRWAGPGRSGCWLSAAPWTRRPPRPCASTPGPAVRASCLSAASTGCAARRCQQPAGPQGRDQPPVRKRALATARCSRSSSASSSGWCSGSQWPAPSRTSRR
jgi:hypothetical protein